MENQEKPHKRRVRYSGTHPKRFSEKYKEHQPEKYADVVEKVIPKRKYSGICTFLSVKEIHWIFFRYSQDSGWTLRLGYGAMLQMLEMSERRGTYLRAGRGSH